MRTPKDRSAVISSLRHWKRIIKIANEQNAQASYNAIVRILDQLTSADENAKGLAANTVAYGLGAALQWTAMERLLDLMNKHMNIKIVG